MSRSIVAELQRLGACQEARDWAASQPNVETAWQQCQRGDWLLWVAMRLRVERSVSVRAAAACARLALPFVADGEHRPLRAIETVERWCAEQATIEEVRAAADDVADAAADDADTAYAAATYAAAYDAATAAAYAAAAAAYAAAAAAYAAADDAAAAAAYAADDAAAAAAYAADDAAAASSGQGARAEMLTRCAEVVRGIIDLDMLLPLWQRLEASTSSAWTAASTR